MGWYLNPKEGTKEDFLKAHGEKTATSQPITETHVPVCLAFNGAFSAAVVCFDQIDAARVNEGNARSDRVYQWYYVARADLEGHVS